MNEELMRAFEMELERLDEMLEAQLLELERSASGHEHEPHVREILDHFRHQVAIMRSKKPERVDQLQGALLKAQSRLN
jgi:hypothetical protein